LRILDDFSTGVVLFTNVGLPAKKSSVNANRTKQIKINIVFGPKASEQSV